MTHEVRKIVVAWVAAALVVVAVPRAQAHHAPSSWCSESGYTCTVVGRFRGVRRLAIKSFTISRYRLCITGPNEERSCGRFRIAAGEDTDAVRWRRHFPFEGEGGYIVEWRRPGGRLIGKVLGFHV